MGAKQWVRAFLLIKLFEPSIFHNRRTTQKIYLHHHHHHPNDHHHHNSHHISTHSLVINQSGTNCKEEESPVTALSHIFCVLKRSGIR